MSFLEDLNVIKQCKNLKTRLWQCPNFLSLVMGIFIIFFIVVSYLIANRFIDDPLSISLIVLIIAAIFLIVEYLIVKSFNALAEANILKSEFINIISHEIRSPLTAIKWSVDLIKEDKLNKENIEQFYEVKESTEKIINLIKILNEVGKIELGKIQLNKQLINISDLTKKIIKEFDSSIKEKKIKPVLNFDKNLPKILTDPNKIKLVIKNLINNAILYNKESGKIIIDIKRKNSKIYWQIKDTGIGISKEQQEKLFQKFFRLNNKMRYQTKGLGLGLFISKNFIKFLGGKIGFKSVKDKGSMFWFTIPIG